MEERLLKFAHLMDAGSFTRAAGDLHISQPALSMAVQKLERELHAQLYVRGSQPLTLTPAGQQAYKTAKELGASVRYLRNSLAELANSELALSIGMIDSVADNVLVQPRTLKTLEKEAKVSLVINNSRYVLQALRRGEVDIAFVVDQGRLDVSDMRLKHVGSEPLVVVAHKQHAATVESQMDRKQLNSFISYDLPSYTHASIERYFADCRVTLSPQFFSSSPDVILRLVLARQGAAALPYNKVRQLLKRGSLVPVRSNGQAVITRHIVCVTRQNYEIPQVMQQMIDQLARDLSQQVYEARSL
jgi:DNA-binding transcriptional LysR family regulator